MRIIPGRKKCRADAAADDVTTDAVKVAVRAAAAAVEDRGHKAAAIAVRAVEVRGEMIAAARAIAVAAGPGAMTTAVAALVEIDAADLVAINANPGRNCRRSIRRSCRAGRWWILWPSRSG